MPAAGMMDTVMPVRELLRMCSRCTVRHQEEAQHQDTAIHEKLVRERFELADALLSLGSQLVNTPFPYCGI
jgi:hypothetical protein